MALLDKQFKGIEPELEGIPKLVYNSQRHSIEKQVEGWESKMKTKLNPTQGGTQPPSLPPSVQEKEKGKEEEKEKEKEKVKEQLGGYEAGTGGSSVGNGIVIEKETISRNDFFEMLSELIRLGMNQDEATILIKEEYEVIN